MNNKTCIGCGETGNLHESDCDCNRTIVACIFCLVEDKVLSCGECGIAEATNEGNEYSVVWARRALKLKRDSADQSSALIAQRLHRQRLKGEIAGQDVEKADLAAEVTRLEAENAELKRELESGEEWKNGSSNNDN